MDANIVEIFYLVDEFCKGFNRVTEGHILEKDNGKKHRNRRYTMSGSGVITIMVPFHLENYRNLKASYTTYIQVHCKEGFPHTLSYNRFIELQQEATVPVTAFLQLCCLGKCTGIPFTNPTPLRAGHIKRGHSHKTFKGLAANGKPAMG